MWPRATGRQVKDRALTAFAVPTKETLDGAALVPIKPVPPKYCAGAAIGDVYVSATHARGSRHRVIDYQRPFADIGCASVGIAVRRGGGQFQHAQSHPYSGPHCQRRELLASRRPPPASSRHQISRSRRQPDRASDIARERIRTALIEPQRTSGQRGGRITGVPSTLER